MCCSRVVVCWLLISSALAALAASAPEGCKKLSVDSDWPSVDVWNTELKGNEPRGPQKSWTAPDYTFEASRVPHVQTAVKFAAKHNVRLSVINSGHDYVARNDAPSGIRLSVTDLKGIRILESFQPTPKGAESVDKTTKVNTIKPIAGKQAAVTIGAGITIDELNKALKPSNLYAIGAAHGSVSVAGGWAQSGGHAPLSSYYGLGVDQVLEYKVVTANGSLVIANPTNNQDLFWALRGGGPSTFGVVVEATVKVHPFPKIISYSFWLNTTDYDDTHSIFTPAAYLFSQLPRLNKENGIQGYYYIHRNALSANWLIPNEFANASAIIAAMDPIIAKMTAMPGINAKSLIKIPPTVLNTTALGSLQSGDGGQSSSIPPKPPAHLVRRHGPGEMRAMAKGNIAMDSRLLGADELTHPDLAKALEKAIGTLPNAQLRNHLTGGGAVLKNDPNTSVLPAWRKTYVHMIAAAAAGEPNLQAMRDISPNMGAYVNEASVKNPNWKHDFWGANYAKLAELKTKWDPDFVFYVTPGINADLMEVKEGRLCRVKGAPAKLAQDMAPKSDNANEGEHEKARTSWPLLYMGKGVPPKMVAGAKGM
ncbi:FAD-binding domain-containing protein [Microthyrium microscopicum]|uniref:FAD-binding domain-containing protein n=1 Tax=Microthyrium microscopicum TaxID=703497 RepID=A0A6A6U7J0_9PEZI|nr:FAD-binding domain-containing protein [Microthyrium microscopicum]